MKNIFLIMIIIMFTSFTSSYAQKKGCLLCHEGIGVINEKMQPFLLSFAQQLYGGAKGYECSVCHEGNPSGETKKEAHKGLINNPSSMWILHEGKGCAKCHDTKNSIRTIMGRRLKQPKGGELLSIKVTSSDPSGSTGIDYTYRMARALMSLETGKANKILSSNGVIKKGTFPYANFHMDDPDGNVPVAGSEAYKRWVLKAINAGFLKRLDHVEEIPDFQKGAIKFKSEEKAGFADIHRKQCGRCHVWSEGRDKRGDLRASGCAACHILYSNNGTYEGNDRAIKESIEKGELKRPLPIKHEITKAIPAAQCTHCHTRGKRIGTTYMGMFEYDYVKDGKAPPFNIKGEPQKPLFIKEYMYVREDVHAKRGMECVDCHTSIEVHGDGNIYPTTYYQVEVSCYDCHGTPDKYPWELPVGYGTPVTLKGVRGTFKDGENEYLLTSKGNVKSNWRRRGGEAYIISSYTGKKHIIPLLKNIKLRDSFKTKQAEVAMVKIDNHMKTMECYSCHASWAPQCFGCHIEYDRRVRGVDWIKTSKNINRVTGRQKIVKTEGNIAIENRSFLRWESPILGVNLKGKVSPLIPGCQVFYT
ncbi:MAG: hypothetical protein D6828_06335, partial [Nitrospirae bacterium]